MQGGEVVSPILRDTPETWDRVRDVCGLITSHGGTASDRTGSHITISSPEQAGAAVRLTRFLRLMHHHQADLHVMAAAGHNRGLGYSAPLAEPPNDGYTRIAQARNSTHRYSFVNLAHVGDRSATGASSRIEFRIWDGSLEPGRIQAQVKMSAALLDYSVHSRMLALDPADRTVGGQINPDHPDFAQQTHQIRGLIDALYRRDSDKEQAAALWAAGLAERQGQRHTLSR